jgi:acyl carrier protein
MELCLENFQMQLDISLVLKEKFLILNTYNSIGICYNKLKEYNKSLEYFEKSSDYINDGYLDSFDIVIIVSELDKLCEISILGEDITPENFSSIDNLSELIYGLNILYVSNLFNSILFINRFTAIEPKLHTAYSVDVETSIISAHKFDDLIVPRFF